MRRLGIRIANLLKKVAQSSLLKAVLVVIKKAPGIIVVSGMAGALSYALLHAIPYDNVSLPSSVWVFQKDDTKETYDKSWQLHSNKNQTSTPSAVAGASEGNSTSNGGDIVDTTGEGRKTPLAERPSAQQAIRKEVAEGPPVLLDSTTQNSNAATTKPQEAPTKGERSSFDVYLERTERKVTAQGHTKIAVFATDRSRNRLFIGWLTGSSPNYQVDWRFTRDATGTQKLATSHRSNLLLPTGRKLRAGIKLQVFKQGNS